MRNVDPQEETILNDVIIKIINEINLENDLKIEIKDIIYHHILGENIKISAMRVSTILNLSQQDAEDFLLNCGRNFHAQFTKFRHEKSGIRAFRWSDSGDSKVCSFCKKRDGKVFSYTEDDLILPGERKGCRCVAEPIFEY